MKEAQVAKDLTVTVRDVAIPEPQADQVVIRVVVSGCNPKDWYVVFFVCEVVWGIFECLLLLAFACEHALLLSEDMLYDMQDHQTND